MRNLSAPKLPILVLLFVVIGGFLRLWNLPNTVQFLGDQGRDALIVARIFTEADPVFIGPVTSVGNMYLGPLYYYFMLPFLWISYPSPMGPAYAVAALGVGTIALMYKMGKELVGERAAAIATGFFALSSTVIENTRFSWNPNPAPIVSLVLMWALYRAWVKDGRYWILAILCFAVLIQLHYLTLLAAGGMGLVWLAHMKKIWKEKGGAKRVFQKLVMPSFAGAVLLLFSLTPLLLFDYKHDWQNVKAFQNMVFVEENFKNTPQVGGLEKLGLTLRETHGRSMHILFEIIVGQNRRTNTLLVLGAVGLLGLAYRTADKERRVGLGVVGSMLLTGILGTSLYEHTIFDHYIAYLFPVTFLTLGVGFDYLLKKKAVGVGALVAFSLFYLSFNIPRFPLQDRSWKLSDVERTSDAILERVEQDDLYNIVLLSESGDIDGQNYRYFLTASDRPPVPESRRGEVNKLFIINEDYVLDKVVDSPIYEIVVFHDKEPKEVFQIQDGPEITVLSTESSTEPSTETN